MRVSGLIAIGQSISPANLNQNFMVNTSIAKGISRGSVLGGMTWGFGDDVIWSFHALFERLHPPFQTGEVAGDHFHHVVEIRPEFRVHARTKGEPPS